jgi:DNA-binding transcriptional LysR family regulator
MLPQIDPRLKLRQLALVVAIDESGSLRKAANMLKITQAAASSLLTELEFILGAPLFSRSRSGTRPTNVGSILIERARPILSNIRATTEELQQAKGGASGDVFVGMLPVAALTIVPVAVRITREHKPNVRIHLIEGTTRQLLDALVRGDLDLIVGRVPQSQISGLIRKEYLLNEPNELVCRAGHPLARKKKLQLSDLAEADWILPEPGSYLWDDVRATFSSVGLDPPQPALVTSSTALRLALFETTDMIGVLTRQTARVYEARGILKILDVKMIVEEAPTLILSRQEGVLTPAAMAFAEHVRDAAQVLKSAV